MVCFKENTVNKPYLEKAKAEVFVTVICDCKKDEKSWKQSLRDCGLF